MNRANDSNGFGLDRHRVTDVTNDLSVLDRPIAPLLVFDDEGVGEMVESVLENRGMETDMLRPRIDEDAIAFLEDRSFDCVVGTHLEERLDGRLLETTSQANRPMPSILVTTTHVDVDNSLPERIDDAVRIDEDGGDYDELVRRILNTVERFRIRESLREIDRQQRLCESLVDSLDGQVSFESVVRKVEDHLLEYDPIVDVHLARFDSIDETQRRIEEAFDFDGKTSVSESLDDVIQETAVTGVSQVISREQSSESAHELSLSCYRLALISIAYEGECRAVLAIRFDEEVPAERRFLERVKNLTTTWIRESTLRSDLRQFRSAVENAGHAVVITDVDGGITYVNPEFESLSGYSPEEAIGQSPALLNSGEHPEEFYRDLWRTILSGKVWQGEIVNERKDGSRYTIDQTIAPIIDDGGDLDGFVAINRDVTARKERERYLRQFRSAVEHAGHAVVITDADGIIEYVNPAFESLSGYSAAEAIGETPSILKSGEHDREFYEALWETILTGDVWRSEVVNERKDGYTYVVDQTIAPIQPEPGESPTGFVSINQDITDLKEYERDLEQQNERLTEYGRMVAHDLRNPLMLLKGRIDELERLLDVDPETSIGELGDELDSSLDGVTETTEYMHRLIEDLLSLAEQGQLVLDPEETSINAVATKAWREIDSPEAHLSVRDEELQADPERFRELLSNLFRNAVEHGGEDVAIEVGPLDFAAGFYVEDDGPGIPDPEREKVFKRGYTTEDNGTGFGLALVDQIAEGHRWDVIVTESTDGGARFEFRAT